MPLTIVGVLRYLIEMIVDELRKQDFLSRWELARKILDPDIRIATWGELWADLEHYLKHDLGIQVEL